MKVPGNGLDTVEQLVDLARDPAAQLELPADQRLCSRTTWVVAWTSSTAGLIGCPSLVERVGPQVPEALLDVVARPIGHDRRVARARASCHSHLVRRVNRTPRRLPVRAAAACARPAPPPRPGPQWRARPAALATLAPTSSQPDDCRRVSHATGIQTCVPWTVSSPPCGPTRAMASTAQGQWCGSARCGGHRGATLDRCCPRRSPSACSTWSRRSHLVACSRTATSPSGSDPARPARWARPWPGSAAGSRGGAWCAPAGSSRPATRSRRPSTCWPRGSRCSRRDRGPRVDLARHRWTSDR